MSASDSASPGGSQDAWPCSAPRVLSPAFCRPAPPGQPSLRSASSISARASIGAGTSPSRPPPRPSRRVPGVRVVQAGYLPESTDYDSGEDNAETRAYAGAIEGLIADGAGLVISTSFGHDPFLWAAAKKHPEVRFRQASALADYDPAAERRQPERRSSIRATTSMASRPGLCTTSNKLGFVAGFAVGPILLNVNSFLLGSSPYQSRRDRAGHLHRRLGGRGARCRGDQRAGRRGLRRHRLPSRCSAGRHRDGGEARRPDLRSRLRPGSARARRATSPAPTMTGAGCSAAFVEAVREGRTPAGFRHRRIRQGLCPVEPVRRRSNA